jgi:hypothetical protein
MVVVRDIELTLNSWTISFRSLQARHVEKLFWPRGTEPEIPWNPFPTSSTIVQLASTDIYCNEPDNNK